MANDQATEFSWPARARAMADLLAQSGSLRTTEWRKALEETPRHLFVDRHDIGLAAADSDSWIATVYSDTTIVVQRRARPSETGSGDSGDGLPTSSSTMPSLMIEMLEVLHVQPGHRVLEIGTGTGYNAALLSSRLGSGGVVSIDIDPELVGVAGSRLAQLGHRPRLVVGDGLDGAAEYGPYDRIIATCAVGEVPLAWIEQLAPNGAMLINLRGDFAGVLCFLVKRDDDEVVGRVVRCGGNFMWMRKKLDSPFRDQESPTVVRARNIFRGATNLDPSDVLTSTELHWFLQLALPGLRSISETEVFDPMVKVSEPGVLVHAEDGSHAQVLLKKDRDGRHRVMQGGGRRRLWDTVEAAHAEWLRLGRPSAQRFGVVANPTVQFVWLDDENGWTRWPLPLVTSP